MADLLTRLLLITVKIKQHVSLPRGPLWLTCLPGYYCEDKIAWEAFNNKIIVLVIPLIYHNILPGTIGTLYQVAYPK